MQKLILTKIDEVWFRIDSELDILYELDSYFQFEVPNARFNPLVQARAWDGIIHLCSIYKQKIYVGLLDQIKIFCKDRNYELEVLPREESDPNVSVESVKQYVDDLNIHSQGKPIVFRDYQYDAVYQCLKKKRRMILSSTGSGKSAQIYSVIRYLEDVGETILLIVPTINLVSQMFSDFADYASASETEWRAESHCHIVYGGKDKNTLKDIMISTWQSIFKMPKDWYHNFSCVIVDEVHLATAKSLTGIMEKSVKAKYRFGFTGTLDITKTKTHTQMLIALFGEPIRVSKTRDLIDRGFLSEIAIKTVVLKYNSVTCKALRRADYQTEIGYIVAHEKRNKFIRNLAISLKGNTLVLFTYVERHGKILYELIKEAAPDKEVHFVYGGTDVEDREKVRALMEKKDGVIAIASSALMSTGTNIRRLNNIIMAMPVKSFIRVIQTIGRGLRTAHDKTKMKLFDIADDFRVGKSKNHTYKHLVLRLQYYAEEEFEYTITEVPLE